MAERLFLRDYDYDLPSELIAQYPSSSRGHDRLLCLSNDEMTHIEFGHVYDLLEPGDLLVLNNTKVIKARLQGTKDTGGACEILIERVIANSDELEAMCLVRSSKPLINGRFIMIADHKVLCLDRTEQFYRLKFPFRVLDFLETFGQVPIPPYLERGQVKVDESRYQTVYGKRDGAVAAPTAGLHFTEKLLNQLQDKGVGLAELTLHVGAGTFQPVRSENIEEHTMHKEWFEISDETARLISNAKESGSRVIAVGTTVVRALESAAKIGQLGRSGVCGETNLFIKPGFQFKVVDCIITNFHLPKSTLLIMICAFAGYDRVMHAYLSAIEEGYQFFSYGDAMWLDRAPCTS